MLFKKDKTSRYINHFKKHFPGTCYVKNKDARKINVTKEYYKFREFHYPEIGDFKLPLIRNTADKQVQELLLMVTDYILQGNSSAQENNYMDTLTCYRNAADMLDVIIHYKVN